jgi:ABC-2 type transport system ATP-binding protein
MTAMSAAIEVEDLQVIRGRRVAVSGLSCKVEAGAVTGLLGPSGSGKSTLIRAIVGVQRITAGRVRVLSSPAGSVAARRRVGYVTQALSIYGDLSVRENVAYFAAILGAERGQTVDVIAAVSLTDDAHRRVDQLSGGQRARVSLATALLGSPEVLVLDEPTVGLDPVLREELWLLFHDLAARGTTVLVSSHVMDEADRCDRLLLLRDGQLLADTTPAALRELTGTADLNAAFLRLVTAPGL